MATIGQLAVNVVAKTAEFVRPVTRARGVIKPLVMGLGALRTRLRSVTFGKINAGISKMVAKLRGSIASIRIVAAQLRRLSGAFRLGGMMTSVFAITLAFRKLKDEMSKMDVVAKESDRLGVTSEQMAQLDLHAQLSGTSMGALSNAMQKLVRNAEVAKAKLASGSAVKSFAAETAESTEIFEGSTDRVVRGFQKLGFTAETLNKSNPFEMLMQVQKGFQSLEGHGEKLTAIFDTMGKTSGELQNFLNSDFGVTADIADRIGLTFSRNQVANIEAANDAMDIMSISWTALERSVAVAVAPFIAQFAESLTATRISVDGIRDGIRGWVGVIGFVADSIQSLIGGFKLIAMFPRFIALTWGNIPIAAEKAANMMAQSLGAFVKWALEQLSKISPFYKKQMKAAIADVDARIIRLKIQRVDIETRIEPIRKELIKLGDDFNALLDQKAWSESIEDFVNKSLDLTKKLQSEAGKATDAPIATSALDALGKFQEKLMDNVVTFGMASREAEIFRLKQQGLSEGLLASVRALDKQLTKLEEQKKLKTTAEKLTESLKTPVEAFRERVTELEKLFFEENLITPETFARALNKAKDDLDKGLEDKAKSTSTENKAVLRGSSEALKEVQKFRRGDSDKLTDIASTNEEAVEALRGIESSVKTLEVFHPEAALSLNF